jgi:hypothetical protein
MATEFTSPAPVAKAEAFATSRWLGCVSDDKDATIVQPAQSGNAKTGFPKSPLPNQTKGRPFAFAHRLDDHYRSGFRWSVYVVAPSASGLRAQFGGVLRLGWAS